MKRYQRFLKFGLVGGVNTAIDFSVFLILVRIFDWDAIAANIVAYAFAVTNSYILNRIWTFRDVAVSGLLLRSFAKFTAVNSLGLLIGTGVIYILSPVTYLEVAKLVSIIFVLAWNYVGMRNLVFHEGK